MTRQVNGFRRVKGVPSRLSAEEVARWRSSRAGVMAMVGHVPRLALGGRDRYGLGAAAAAEVNDVLAAACWGDERHCSCAAVGREPCSGV